MSSSDQTPRDDATTLGKIQLAKQAVDSTEYVAHKRAALRRGDPREVARLNKLVPYLDLFERLSDRELARLADVPELTATQMREQVVTVRRKLGRFEPLLERLDDVQLARVADTSPKMFQYLRLCQPRHRPAQASSGTRAARLRAVAPPGVRRPLPPPRDLSIPSRRRPRGSPPGAVLHGAAGRGTGASAGSGAASAGSVRRPLGSISRPSSSASSMTTVSPQRAHTGRGEPVSPEVWNGSGPGLERGWAGLVPRRCRCGSLRTCRVRRP